MSHSLLLVHRKLPIQQGGRALDGTYIMSQ